MLCTHNGIHIYIVAKENAHLAFNNNHSITDSINNYRQKQKIESIPDMFTHSASKTTRPKLQSSQIWFGLVKIANKFA
jgi:hypothetical protein